MNAVEIEGAVSALVENPFDAAGFPYQFLAALGDKDTKIKRLRAGSTNAYALPDLYTKKTASVAAAKKRKGAA